jgi:hypothetical protein
MLKDFWDTLYTSARLANDGEYDNRLRICSTIEEMTSECPASFSFLGDTGSKPKIAAKPTIM